MALRRGSDGVAPGSVPKLMLIASALWSTAHTIEAATLESLKSDLMTRSWQPSPAPASPTPLLPAAHASDATCVPCPIVSSPAGERAASNEARPATRPTSSGWPISAPGSMTATGAPAPWLMCQACGNPLRAAHHSTVVPGTVSFAVSGVTSAGSLGWKRSAARRSAATDAARGSAPRAAVRVQAADAGLRPQPRRERMQGLAGARAHVDEPDLRHAEAAWPGARGGGDGVHGRGARGDMSRRGRGLERDEQPTGPVGDGRVRVGR